MVSEPLGATHLAAPLAMEDYSPFIPSSPLATAHSSARRCLELRPCVLLNAALCAPDLRGEVRCKGPQSALTDWPLSLPSTVPHRLEGKNGLSGRLEVMKGSCRAKENKCKPCTRCDCSNVHKKSHHHHRILSAHPEPCLLPPPSLGQLPGPRLRGISQSRIVFHERWRGVYLPLQGKNVPLLSSS